MTSRGPSRATWMRAAAAVAALGAAWGPEVPGARRPALRVLVADVSVSTGVEGPREQDLRAVAEGLGRDDRAAVIVFAETAQIACRPAPPSALSDSGARPGRWGTSFAAALRAAASLGRPGDRLELLLATDGRSTDDAAELDDAVVRVRAAGGADVVVAPIEGPDVRSVVRSLRGPGRVLAGETFALDASGVAGPTGATIDLLESGAVVETRRIDGAGSFRTTFSRTADTPGLRTWEARTREAPDVPVAAAHVAVAAPGTVALLHGGSAAADLATAVGGFAVVVDAARVPAADVADAVAGCDAVVVDAFGFDATALARYVRGGGGVLLLHPDAAQDALSPLRTTPPEEAGVAVYLAVDGSGSMDEPWPGTTDGLPRDAAVRAAAAALVRGAAPGTSLWLRRFRESLVPAGPPLRIDLGSGPRDDAVRAVGGLPSPGGSTAFLPVLREAFDVLAGRAEPRRAAILLTDGRSSETAESLAPEIDRLAAAGVRVAVVVPGPLDDESRRAPLLAALRGPLSLFAADDPERLRAVLAEAESALRGANESLHGVPLEAAPGAAPLVRPEDVPPRAEVMVRRFATPDATVLVRTTAGVPFAAVRREGPGNVAAIAAIAPRADTLAGDHGAALVRALVRAVRRRGAADVRVESDDAAVRVRLEQTAPAALPTSVRFHRRGTPVGRAPLRPVGAGVLEAAMPPGERADFVSIDDASGTEIAGAGLDRPAPREVGDVPALDLAVLASRLRPGAAPLGTPLRAPLAVLAVLLLVLGSVKSASRRTR